MSERNKYLSENTLPRAPDEAVALIKARAESAAVMVLAKSQGGVGKSFGSGYAVGEYIITNYHVIDNAGMERDGRHYAMLVDSENRVGFGEVIDFNSLGACGGGEQINPELGLVDAAILRPVDRASEEILYYDLMGSYVRDIISNKLNVDGAFNPTPFTLDDLRTGINEMRNAPEDALIPVVISGNPHEAYLNMPEHHAITQQVGSIRVLSGEKGGSLVSLLTPEGEQIVSGQSGSLGVSLSSGRPVMHIVASATDMTHPHHAAHQEDRSFGTSIDHIYNRLKALPETMPPLHSLDCTPLNLEWANTGDAATLPSAPITPVSNEVVRPSSRPRE